MKTILIFGGAGFIGIHFSNFLLRSNLAERVVIADLKNPAEHAIFSMVESDISSGRVRYVNVDVRCPIEDPLIDGERLHLIANFAAIHREPGHFYDEYYETNIPGAENVCAYAKRVDCKCLIFTSSISPYGPSEIPKNENSIPTPETAYGGSKLAAELIHKAWANEKGAGRKLLIVRPGVVFGPGEGGNVSRLVKLVSRGFFPFAGNKETRKAGIYVKELCAAMVEMHIKMQDAESNTLMVNMTMDPCPSVYEYVEAATKVASRTVFTPSLNGWILLKAAYLIGALSSLMGANTSINTVRVRKLLRSNNIEPGVLRSMGYNYKFSLLSAFQDWKKSFPKDWR